MFLNIPWKTAGGKVFWDTLAEKGGWKLQQNMFTEHYRILDPDNIRRSWGTDATRMWQDFNMFTGGQNQDV